MRVVRAIAIVAFLMTALRVAAAGAQEAAGAGGAPLVTATVVASAAEVAPGAVFEVGVLLRVRPGWHVYWKNPGDMGFATAVAFEGPPGVTFGPLRWPAPRRFVQPGDVVGFGYEGEVLLSVEARVAGGADGARAGTIRARVEWLACADECVPGDTEAALALPQSAEAAAAGARAIAASRARAPVGAGELAEVERVEMRLGARDAVPGGGVVEIDIAWRAAAPAGIEVFPAPDARTLFEVPRVATAGRTSRIAIPAKPVGRGGTARPGGEVVIAFAGEGGERRALAVDLAGLDGLDGKEGPGANRGSKHGSKDGSNGGSNDGRRQEGER